MDTERLGVELGYLICEMSDESIEEIDDAIRTLGTMTDIVFLEYIVLLLWIAAAEASIIFPDKSSQHATNVAFSVVFDFLNEIEEIRDHPEFNVKKFQKLIHDRFRQYYGAFNNPTIDEDDEENVTVRQNFNVVLCFISCCFADITECFNKDKSVISGTSLVVGHHYCRFSERVRSVLSRY